MAARKSGERYFADLSRCYANASTTQAATLLQARQLMKSAYRDYSQSLSTQAIRSYRQAALLFRQAGDTGEAWLAEFWLAFCQLQQRDWRPGLQTLELLADRCATRRYKWLQSLVLIGLTNARYTKNEYTLAIKAGRDAHLLAEELNDPNGQLRSLNLLTLLYRAVGRWREAWHLAQQGIELAGKVGADPSQLVGYYSECTYLFRALDLYPAALSFAQATLRLSEAMNWPLVTSRYHVNLGVLYGQMNRYATAVMHLERGLAIGQSVPDEETRAEMIAYAWLGLGRTYRLHNELEAAHQALEHLTPSAELKDASWLWHDAAKERLLLRLARGETAAVQPELEQVIALYEADRAKILEESNRNSFFDQQQSIYDIAIDFSHSQLGDITQAFEYAEISRARSLLDAFAGGQPTLVDAPGPDLRFPQVSQPLRLTELQRRMPAGVQLLQYAVLPDKLIIWVVTPQRLASRAVKVSSTQLADLVIRYLEQVTVPPGQDTRALEIIAIELHEQLIKPVLPLLAKDKQVCIIPDKILNFLPYGALLARATQRSLLEEYSLHYAPSASLFVLATETLRQRTRDVPSRILSVGNPLLDRQAFPDLIDLPAAAHEAAQVANCYGCYGYPCLLIGAQVTREALLRGLEQADVVHLALHHVPDPVTSLFSKLPLASARGKQLDEPATLEARDIYQLNLKRTRLLVLSACQTRAEGYYRGEGAIGLTRAFQVAGIPLVVASLWAVDSQATAELMVDFHSQRQRQRISAAEALRAAQLKMLHGADERYRHPYYWASFVAVGGYSEL